MIKVKEIIVVEGRYDKNTVSQVVDATVIETAGFGIFKDKEKIELLRTLAKKRGIIVLTDSDGAGFVIRSHIKNCLGPGADIKQAYIPDIYGKERRKKTPSKAGTLGVEGMKPDVIIDALRKAGATFESVSQEDGSSEKAFCKRGVPHDCSSIGTVPASAISASDSSLPITKADMLLLGLAGAGSTKKREDLKLALKLPKNLSTNGLLQVLNVLFTRDEFIKFITDKSST